MTQSLKHDGPVQMSFGIGIRDAQSLVELLQGRFRISQHGQAKTGLVVDIGETRVLLQHGLEQLQGRL